MQQHKALAREIRRQAQASLGDRVRLFERHAGVFVPIHGGPPVTPFPEGQADLYGWVVVCGVARHVEIELKVGRDKLSEIQEAWRALCERQGVHYMLVQMPAGGDVATTAANVVSGLATAAGEVSHG